MLSLLKMQGSWATQRYWKTKISCSFSLMNLHISSLNSYNHFNIDDWFNQQTVEKKGTSPNSVSKSANNQSLKPRTLLHKFL